MQQINYIIGLTYIQNTGPGKNNSPRGKHKFYSADFDTKIRYGIAFVFESQA